MADVQMGESEGFPFQAHMKQMNQVSSVDIKKFYSQKETVLREAINNSFDAFDVVRFESLTDKSKLDAQPELFIRRVPDKTNNVIGMTKAEGFVVTAKHNDDEQCIWESQAGGPFTVARDVNGEQLGRGTKITLILKDDQLEYLKERRIKDFVKKQSEVISYPIDLWTEKTTEKEISDDEDDELKKVEEGDVEEVAEEKETTSKKKKIKEVYHEWQHDFVGGKI